MRDSEEESWTLLAEDHGPVESVERFLSSLASIEKSPNTVKAYAHDLKNWLDWRRATLEDVAGLWRGCGFRRRPVLGRSRCCRLWSIIVRRPA